MGPIPDLKQKYWSPRNPCGLESEHLSAMAGLVLGVLLGPCWLACSAIRNDGGKYKITPMPNKTMHAVDTMFGLKS